MTESLDDSQLTVSQPDALAEIGDQTIGLARASAIANELAVVIREKRLSVNIKGQQHLKIEAWTCLATMVGCSPRTAWTRDAKNPLTDATGILARVEVVRMADGQVIGAAEAACFGDEEIKKRDGTVIQRWNDAHQVISMAQTRAASKALGQVLRWIPVMAGFSGTPEAEMDPPAEPAIEYASDEEMNALNATAREQATVMFEDAVEREQAVPYADIPALEKAIKLVACKHLKIAAKDRTKIQRPWLSGLAEAIAKTVLNEKGKIEIPEGEI